MVTRAMARRLGAAQALPAEAQERENEDLSVQRMTPEDQILGDTPVSTGEAPAGRETEPSDSQPASQRPRLAMSDTQAAEAGLAEAVADPPQVIEPQTPTSSGMPGTPAQDHRPAAVGGQISETEVVTRRPVSFRFADEQLGQTVLGAQPPPGVTVSSARLPAAQSSSLSPGPRSSRRGLARAGNPLPDNEVRIVGGRVRVPFGYDGPTPSFPQESAPVRPQMSPTDAMLYAELQHGTWAHTPPGLVTPADPVYPSRAEGWRMREYLRCAIDTSDYLDSIGVPPQVGWSASLRMRLVRLPVRGRMGAYDVDLARVSPAVAVAVLQTMLLDLGYQFENVIPSWDSFGGLGSVRPIEIRREVEMLRGFLYEVRDAWDILAGDVPYRVRDAREPNFQVTATSAPADADTELLQRPSVRSLMSEDFRTRVQWTKYRTRPASDRASSSSRGSDSPSHVTDASMRSDPARGPRLGLGSDSSFHSAASYMQVDGGGGVVQQGYGNLPVGPMVTAVREAPGVVVHPPTFVPPPPAGPGQTRDLPDQAQLASSPQYSDGVSRLTLGPRGTPSPGRHVQFGRLATDNPSTEGAGLRRPETDQLREQISQLQRMLQHQERQLEAEAQARATTEQHVAQAFGVQAQWNQSAQRHLQDRRGLHEREVASLDRL